METPVTLTTKTGVLHGTLLIPAGTKSPMPVALLIAGSGPTDRIQGTGRMADLRGPAPQTEGVRMQRMTRILQDYPRH